MRRFLIFLGWLLGLALLAAAAMPWWLGWALKAGGPGRGMTFGSYERVGYGRFALKDVVVVRPRVRVTVLRIEADTPMLWLWRHGMGNSRVVRADSWHVDVLEKRQAEAATILPRTRMGAMRLRRQLLKIADGLQRWAPRAQVGPGAVNWRGGTVALAEAAWHDRTLTTKAVRFRGLIADVTAEFMLNDEIRAQANGGQGWQASARNRAAELTGEVQLWQQRATLSARFGEQGWLPSEAKVRAPAWEVSGAQLKLGALYAMVSGWAVLDWQEGNFTTTLDVKGEPLSGRKVPPLVATLVATLRGRGGVNALTIDSLVLTLPGIKAHLSAPVVIDRRGQMQSGPSSFGFEANLAEQPWFVSRGRVSGEARLTPRAGRVPQVDFIVDGHEVVAGEWTIPRLAVKATLDWPRLVVEKSTVTLADKNSVVVHGTWNFQSKELSGVEAEGTVNGGLLARWLPAGIAAETVTLMAKVEGVWPALRHAGRIHVTRLSWGKAFQPVELAGDWKGEGTAAEIAEGEMKAGGTVLAFAGTVDPAGARLTRLQLAQGDAERLKLSQPVTIRWAPSFEIGPVQLTGAEGSLAFEVTGGPVGRFVLKAHHLPSSWWSDFVVLPAPAWQVARAEAKGDWNRGPLSFSAQGEMQMTLGQERSATLAVVASGDGSGLLIESLRAAEGPEPIVTATGQLPLTFHPGTAKLLHVEAQAPLVLNATTTSNPGFWKRFTALTGIELQQPEVRVQLSGTWSQPRGEVHVRVARAAPALGRLTPVWPTLEALEADATADGNVFKLDRLTVRVDGQRVEATAQLPVSAERWNEVRRDPVAYLRREVTLQVQIPDADMAAVARYAPRIFAPKGRLKVNASIKPGGHVEGMLQLRDAASRPLGPLGLLQEISADIQLSGRSAELRGVTAKAGGQPVTLAGKITWPQKGAPAFDLTLKGDNLPFVRKTGLLLRGDLNLALTTDPDGVPRLAGVVRLRDSLFLSDVRALIPRGGTGPARRPPYFAVEAGPLRDWRLAVDVTGERFLRLRTTFFVGVASARLKLAGTLGDPRLTGEAAVDRGQVQLPFATFAVQQGAVRLTAADPHEPRINLTGTSRRYGYDLRMEITGTVSAPAVTFTSSPPLDAEQVLLMVMAGETPRNEVTYTGNQRFARLGTYLGQNLINSLGGDATDAERLNISTGEKVSRQGRETYELEYNLTPRFRLVGEYDEFDAYNLGIKWRLFQWKTIEAEKEKEERAADEKK